MSPPAAGAAAGVVLGVLARVAMRAVALLTGREPSLDLRVSAVLVGLFVLAGTGGGVAVTLWARHRLAATGVGVLTAGPLLLLGTAFGVGELLEVLEADVAAAPRTLSLLLAALVIIAVGLTPAWALALRLPRPRALPARAPGPRRPPRR